MIQFAPFLAGAARFIGPFLAGLLADLGAKKLGGYVFKEGAEQLAKRLAGKGAAVAAGKLGAKLVSRAPAAVAKRLPTTEGAIRGALEVGEFLGRNAAFMGGMIGTERLLSGSEPDARDWPEVSAMPRQDLLDQDDALNQWEQVAALQQAVDEYTGGQGGRVY